MVKTLGQLLTYALRQALKDAAKRSEVIALARKIAADIVALLDEVQPVR